jgi:hypothetical protein
MYCSMVFTLHGSLAMQQATNSSTPVHCQGGGK